MYVTKGLHEARDFARAFVRSFTGAFASEAYPISVGKSTEMCICMWLKAFKMAFNGAFARGFTRAFASEAPSISVGKNTVMCILVYVCHKGPS